MKPLLQIDGVTKRYGDLVAVDDVSLDIYPGEIFALLGPNGAGKTTLINCISGLTVGFEGSIQVAGFDVVDDYRVTRRLIGLVPQEINYDAFFSVKNTLAFQGGYFGVPPDDEQIEELLEQFSLKEKINATSRWLSGGMKRRLMICKALMHDPVLLFLDEPTAGVDVELRDELWEYVRGLRDQGTTVVLTTHYLEEAEELADRIGIIHRGRLLRVQGRDALMNEFGSHTATIRLLDDVPADFADRFDVELQIDGRRIDVAYDEEGVSGASPIDQVLRELYAEGLTIDRLEARSSSLEEIFKDLVFEREAK
jgi:ABC-2 type transport system ATP-binding protein